MRRADIRFRNGDPVRLRAERHPLDNLIREAAGDPGMHEGVQATIRLVNEFEGFGSYETWEQGYIVEFRDVKTGDFLGRGSSRYLDTAIERALADKKRRTPTPP